jgi:hypothetical protein
MVGGGAVNTKGVAVRSRSSGFAAIGPANRRDNCMKVDWNLPPSGPARRFERTRDGAISNPKNILE